MNNYDRIKGMDFLQFLDFFSTRDRCDYCIYDGNVCINGEGNCSEGVKRWFKMEVKVKMYKYDQIMNMGPLELAKFFARGRVCCCCANKVECEQYKRDDCFYGITNWLLKEAEVEND